ncbi:MAG: hypothetical protein QOI48_3183 [Solirubrobacteraceae bacterium]|jgi:hypothetical protein|nr:hypothetical protein [Solirubrobacteraceae bacterium]
MVDQPQWYEQILDLQLRNNADIWAQLQEHGVAEETQLQLGFTYMAPGQEEAEQLASFLVEETDYEVESRTHNGEWFVFGVTQPTTVSSELLDSWVEWMVAAGAAEGPCAFDGWQVVGGTGWAE